MRYFDGKEHGIRFVGFSPSGETKESGGGPHKRIIEEAEDESEVCIDILCVAGSPNTPHSFSCGECHRRKQKACLENSLSVFCVLIEVPVRPPSSMFSC